MHRLNYIRKTRPQDIRKSRIKTKSIIKGQFLWIKVESRRDILTVRGRRAGHFSCCLPGLPFLHLLGYCEPPVGNLQGSHGQLPCSLLPLGFGQ